MLLQLPALEDDKCQSQVHGPEAVEGTRDFPTTFRCKSPFIDSSYYQTVLKESPSIIGCTEVVSNIEGLGDFRAPPPCSLGQSFGSRNCGIPFIPIIHFLDHAIQYPDVSSDDVGLHSMLCLGGQPVEEVSQNKGDDMVKCNRPKFQGVGGALKQQAIKRLCGVQI